MAVLAQKIIPADYSYVIHTKNPSTNDDNEVYAEVVLGMGETLVGTYEGQSFSFTYNKSIYLYNLNFIFII
jgi:alpha-glucan,water dikinase